MLRTVLELIDNNLFQDYLDDLLSRLMSSSQTNKFGAYFQKYYVPKKDLWAYCKRLGYGINTNMHVEAFHRVLKYKYLGGKYNRRVDTCLITLMKYNRDRVFGRLTKLVKGGKGHKLTVIYKRHQASMLLPSTDVTKMTEKTGQFSRLTRIKKREILTK